MRVLHIFLDESANVAWQGLAALGLGCPGKDGYTPVVACLEGSALAEELAAARVEVLPLPKGLFRQFFAWRRIAKAQRERPFAVIHTHDAMGARLGAKCREAWPGVRWAHSWRSHALPALQKDFDRFHRADALTVLNQETAKRLAAQNFAGDSIRVIPLGIDPAAYPSRLEPRHNSQDERLHFAAVGPLTIDSGFEPLLAALARFTAACPQADWELRLVGEGELFHGLLRLAETLGIRERMALLGAQRSCDILPHCDILIAPDLGGENGCAAIKEAWAVGLPVLCSDLPVQTEMVQDRVSGLVAPRGDAEVLSQRLGELAASRELQRELARCGRAALEAYTHSRVFNAYMELYEHLTAVSPGAEAQRAEENGNN